MGKNEKILQVMDEIVSQVNAKDELYYVPFRIEEKEAVRLLQIHKIVLVGTRCNERFLFPGENFNKLLNQGAKSYFSSEFINNSNLELLKFSKSDWAQVVIIVLVFLLVIVLLYFTIKETY